MRRTATRMMIERSDRDARLAEAIRLTEQLVAARQAADANRGIVYSTAYYTTDPGPDFTPRPWR